MHLSGDQFTDAQLGFHYDHLTPDLITALVWFVCWLDPFLTVVVFIRPPGCVQVQPDLFINKLQPSPSKQGSISHHCLVFTIRASTQAGFALVVPAICPFLHAHLAVCLAIVLRGWLLSLSRVTISQVPAASWPSFKKCEWITKRSTQQTAAPAKAHTAFRSCMVRRDECLDRERYSTPEGSM